MHRPLKDSGARADAAQLALDQVSKRYGDVVALDKLSLTIDKPQFVTLLGPSGCGKTTTLRLVAGLETCDSGRIYMHGQRIDNVSPHKRNVSTVFQDYALFPHLDVFDNVAFGLKVRGATREDYTPKVRATIERLQIADLAKRRPYQLSGGQQQRVALARTLVLNPAILLFDEPLGALDQNLREDMQIELKRVQRQVGITFIYVTHDQREAFTMSDRVVVLSKGRIEQDDTPQEVYRRPRSLFVGKFTGVRNLIAGTVERVAGERAIVALKSGDRLEADVPDGLRFACGERVLIGVRPEAVVLGAAATSDGASLRLTVHSVVYGGKSYSAAGTLKSGEVFTLEIPAGSGQVASAREGQEVAVRWRRDDTLIFKAEKP